MFPVTGGTLGPSVPRLSTWLAVLRQKAAAIQRPVHPHLLCTPSTTSSTRVPGQSFTIQLLLGHATGKPLRAISGRRRGRSLDSTAALAMSQGQTREKLQLSRVS